MCRTNACGCSGGSSAPVGLMVALVLGAGAVSLAVAALAALAPALWAAAGVVFGLVSVAGAAIWWQVRRLTRPVPAVRPARFEILESRKRALPAPPLAIEAPRPVVTVPGVLAERVER